MEADHKFTGDTVTLTPHWDGMRAYVRNMFRSDKTNARNIAWAMGCEAPNLSGMCCPNCKHATTDHSAQCPVGARAYLSN